MMMYEYGFSELFLIQYCGAMATVTVINRIGMMW